MEISKDCFVSIDYTLSDDDGAVIDSSKERGGLAYVHGNGNLIPGLENALQGRTSGDSFKVSVAPEEGYGVYDESMKQAVPMDQFQGVDNVEPGMQFQARTANGVQIITVLEVNDNEVFIDGNHPMAGKTLHFEVDVKEVREATEEEMGQGVIV